MNISRESFEDTGNENNKNVLTIKCYTFCVNYAEKNGRNPLKQHRSLGSP